MNYHHLTIEERSCIRKYYVEGLSYRKIAQLIGRSPSTVSREINRNRTHMYDVPTYYPHTAQKKYLSTQKQLRVWLDSDKFETFKKVAELSGTSMHRLINDYIDEYLFQYRMDKVDKKDK